MYKIDRLTSKQEQELIEWRRRWFEIGSSCEPANRPLIQQALTRAYEIAGYSAPQVAWCDSPLTATLLTHILKSGNTPLIPLEASLRASLRASLGIPLAVSLWTSLGTSLGASLGASLEASLRASLRASLEASLWDSKIKIESARFTGQIDAYWIAFYLFCEHIGVKYKPSEKEKLDIMSQLTGCGWWWPYEGVCIVSERPLAIHWSDTDPPVLHNDGGPAVEFRDGWKVWVLNGVRVPQKIAETPASQLDPQLIVKEQNIEIRREILRKIGVERAMSVLEAQTVDKATIMTRDGQFHDYELLLLPLDSNRRYPYLKMENPSLADVFHIEGVHEDCRTVKDALAWRIGAMEFETPDWIH